MGQVINLPQCGLTCPNAIRGALEGAVRALGAVFIAVPPGPRASEPGHPALRAFSMTQPVRRAQFSQRYRAFTALPHFASVIILAKCRYPFENSASLVKRPGCLPRGCGFPLKTRHCLQNDPCAVPTARIQRQSSGTAVGAAPCERPNWLVFYGGAPSGGSQSAKRGIFRRRTSPRPEINTGKIAGNNPGGPKC